MNFPNPCLWIIHVWSVCGAGFSPAQLFRHLVKYSAPGRVFVYTEQETWFRDSVRRHMLVNFWFLQAVNLLGYQMNRRTVKCFLYRRWDHWELIFVFVSLHLTLMSTPVLQSACFPFFLGQLVWFQLFREMSVSVLTVLFIYLFSNSAYFPRIKS